MNTPANRQLQALIFDLDGTLVDSRLDFSAMRRELSAPVDIGLLEFADSLGEDRAKREAMAVIERHEMAGAEAATWMPGAEDALHSLCAGGVPTAIVTRNSRRAALRTMKRLGMPQMPVKAREDAAPKPDPEALLAIAASWQIATASCAYVGDFRFDIEAAQRAGMLPVLYVGDAGPPGGYAGTVTILRHFAELRDWFSV